MAAAPPPAADASALYAKARRLVATIEYQLQQLEEAAPLGSTAAAAAAAGADDARHALAANVNALAGDVAALDRAVGEQYGGAGGVGGLASPPNPKAQLWRKRVSQLQSEAMSLRRTVERFLRLSYATSRVAQERQQLLGGAAASAQQSVAVDALLSERSSVTHSSAMVDELGGLADHVLGALRSQRGVMKSAHRKVLDVATSLGVSNTLMRMIERRTAGDRIIVYGGMLVILALLGVVWYWGRR